MEAWEDAGEQNLRTLTAWDVWFVCKLLLHQVLVQ